MVLLNALAVDIVFEAVRLIVIAAVMLLAIYTGKKLRDRADAKKTSEGNVSGEE